MMISQYVRKLSALVRWRYEHKLSTGRRRNFDAKNCRVGKKRKIGPKYDERLQEPLVVKVLRLCEVLVNNAMLPL